MEHLDSHLTEVVQEQACKELNNTDEHCRYYSCDIVHDLCLENRLVEHVMEQQGSL